MKKLVKPFLFIAFIVFLTGCPFEAKFPLDEPSIDYVEDLLGTYVEDGSDMDDHPSLFVLEKINDYSFKVIEKEYDEDMGEYEETEYSGFLSKIEDTYFLNLYAPEDDVFYFYKFNYYTDNSVKLSPVTDYISEEFSSSEELKEYFRKNMHISFFYQEATTYNHL